jgi:hypothetical protein
LSLNQLLSVALMSFYRIILPIREKSINSMENELKQLIIDADKGDMVKIFSSVSTLAAFIKSTQDQIVHEQS